jgi:hypothetical protein
VLVVIDKVGGEIVIVSVLVAVCGSVALSVTTTTKLYVLMLAGVPLSDPAVDRLRPVGREPDWTAHEYGPMPPVALNPVAGYDAPTTPFGRTVVVTDRTAATRIVNVLVAVRAALSTTSTTKSYVFGVVGVPLSVPLLDSISPGGSVPD